MKSKHAVARAVVTGGGKLQNCQFGQQFLKMYKVWSLCVQMDVIFWRFFKCTFANKHSVSGDQINSSTSGTHSNAARDCLSAVVPQTAQFGFKQTQLDAAEERVPTEKGGKKCSVNC